MGGPIGTDPITLARHLLVRLDNGPTLIPDPSPVEARAMVLRNAEFVLCLRHSDSRAIGATGFPTLNPWPLSPRPYTNPHRFRKYHSTPEQRRRG